jgi:hypothetical protein
MIERIATLLFPLLLASCTFIPGGTDTEKLRDVLVPGYDTPSRILYSRGDSATCRAISQRSIEVTDRQAEHRPFRNGYSQVRVETPDRRYRAFFRPERLETAPSEASFIFCTNDSTPIALNCEVPGVIEDGCFETGYGWYKLSEIDSLISQIRRNAPRWGGT